MKHARFFPLFSLLLLLFLPGCVFFTADPPVAGPDAERRYDDAGIKTDIASGLLKIDAAKANRVNVHCYDGHVFLIGEADKEFRAKALDFARKVEDVVHVTTHWFPPGTSSALRDAAIEAEIDGKLFFADDINARRVDIDVWGGHVVLTGLVGRQSEIDSAVAAIKKIQQVRSVTSYLSLMRETPERETHKQEKAEEKKAEQEKARPEQPPKKRNPHAAVSPS
jgi:osmotically-inducible protein OsmY